MNILVNIVTLKDDIIALRWQTDSFLPLLTKMLFLLVTISLLFPITISESSLIITSLLLLMTLTRLRIILIIGLLLLLWVLHGHGTFLGADSELTG